MNKIYTLATVIFGALALASCNNEDMWGDDAPGANQGQLELQLNNNAKTNSPRADVEAGDNGEKPGVFDAAEVNVQNYTLTITDGEGQTIKSGLVSELGGNNGNLTLANVEQGTINVAAENYDGSSQNVSTRPWFRGTATGSILSGKTTEMTVTCKLQNIEVKIALAQSFLDKFKDDYSITVDNGEGGIQTFTKNNVKTKYYFLTPNNKNSINVSIKATTKETNAFIQRNYTVTKPTDADGCNILAAGVAFIIILIEDGSMLSYINFGITVDFIFAEQEEIFTIPTTNITYDESLGGDEGNGEVTPGQPTEEVITFTGLPADLTDPDLSGQTVKVDMSVKNGIKNLFVTITSDNAGFLGAIAGLGLGETFDLANPGDLEPVLTGSLDTGEGIGLLQPGEVVAGKTSYTFDVTNFMGLLQLFNPAQNKFHIEVVDALGNSKSGDLNITINQR